MAENTQFNLSEDQERAIILYASKAHELLLNQFSIRSRLEEIDKYYMREGNLDAAQIKNRQLNRAGRKSKIQDITIPVVMPQVRSAHGYMVNVFCTGYPIFGVTADPTVEDAAMQMETIVAENAITAGWTRELMLFFLDGLKYNLHAIECEWQNRTVATIETDINFPESAKPKTTIWKGNVLKRIDLYNSFYDPRVMPTEIHSEGEYAGYIEMYSRVRMKKLLNNLHGKVKPGIVLRAFESSPPSYGISSSSTNPFSYYMPIINPSPLMNNQSLSQTFDWMAWATSALAVGTNTIKYQNVYQIMKIYARILPADFGLDVPEKNTPQVWKFYIVNGSVVIFAERQTNVHGYIPIFFGQPLEDGLGYQTKSFADNVTDIQDFTSSMWSGYLASKRRLVGDRVLYDPSRIAKQDINTTNPEAKIPVRSSAYGKPVNEAVYQFPFRDEQTQSLVEGATLATRYADLINGQNPAQKGQFVKGNKTKGEWDDTMGAANSNNQVMALMAEAQVFTPLKEVVKLNILQYQPEVILFNRDRNQNVAIKPVDLRKAAVHFKVSDGMLPSDKLMSTDEYIAALQMLGSSPALGAAYNLAPAFSFIMKTRGADLRPFEKTAIQIQYEQQLQAWQQAAALAAQKGTPFSTPMPQIPPELKGQASVQQSATGLALEATQG